MPKWHPKRLKKHAKKAYHRIGGSDVVKRRDIATAFAEKHGLLYFHTVSADNDRAPVIRGSTVAPHQVDSNFCIGTHAGYDMAVIERSAEMSFGTFEPSLHRWYVLEIDLHDAHDLPYVFVGTKQQSRVYYARVLMSRRNLAHIQSSLLPGSDDMFHSQHAVIASPADISLIQRLFDQPVTQTIGHHYPSFAIEIEGDSLIVTTDATKPSARLMDELLHFGLWLAKEIDSRHA